MVRTRSSSGQTDSPIAAERNAAVTVAAVPANTTMEVRLKSADGTTRSVHVQAARAAAALGGDALSRAAAATTTATTTTTTNAATNTTTNLLSNLHARRHGAAGGSSTAGGSEKRVGEPVTSRDIENPRKRARSTSPLRSTATGASGGGGGTWRSAGATDSSPHSWSGGGGGGETDRSWWAGSGGPASGAGGEPECSESDEEDLPPGDRVAYIHVGEGGEADLEAQLKGKLMNVTIEFHGRFTVPSAENQQQ